MSLSGKVMRAMEGGKKERSCCAVLFGEPPFSLLFSARSPVSDPIPRKARPNEQLSSSSAVRLQIEQPRCAARAADETGKNAPSPPCPPLPMLTGPANRVPQQACSDRQLQRYSYVTLRSRCCPKPAATDNIAALPTRTLGLAGKTAWHWESILQPTCVAYILHRTATNEVTRRGEG